jgi:DNA-binding transcriptional LysR family regulator
VTLLDRTPSGFQLTQTGAAILDQVTQMEEAALSLERTISGGDCRLEGVVRITAVEAFAAHILAPGFKPLHAAHPGIVIELIADNRSLSLARREADIAVRLGRFEAHETVVRKIGEMTFAVYAAPSYLERLGQPDWTQGASGHRLVRVQDDLLDTPDAHWFAERARAAEPVLLANSREAQLRGVAAGLGLGCLPCYLADGYSGIERVVVGAEPSREIWMGVHRDTRHAPRIVAAQDAIVDAVTAARSLLVPGTM